MGMCMFDYFLYFSPYIFRGNSIKGWFPLLLSSMSVRPSVPPSRQWLTPNISGTIAARKTMSSSFDRRLSMPNGIDLGPQFLRSGVRNRGYFTASRCRQNNHDSCNVTKMQRLARNWWDFTTGNLWRRVDWSHPKCRALCTFWDMGKRYFDKTRHGCDCCLVATGHDL